MHKVVLLSLLAFPCSSQWTSPGIGFDFRATSGYVTDPTSTRYVLGSGGDAYPNTQTIGGVSVTFGWRGAVSLTGCAGGQIVSALDRDSTLADKRMAGMNYTAAVCAAFQVDGLTPGSYDIDLALGDTSAGWTIDARIYDDTTLLFTPASAVTTNADEFIDATGVKRTSNADWTTNHAVKTLTFASTTFRLIIGLDAGINIVPVAHLRIKQNVAVGVKRRGKGPF